MKKTPVSKLFLYRYRFIIGYVILGLAFITIMFLLPSIAQRGLSQAEIDSATSSFYLGKDGILQGDLVNLPYRLLQKCSILLFGLTPFAIKLPSIIVGLVFGLLLILLLNRWFKTNVSLLSSFLIILSTPFLFLAGSGTPLVMIVFWPTLLLWLGSKIQGEKRPKPLYSFAFAIALLFAIFTPFMIYFAIFCVLFVIMQPHLRFIIKDLPKLPLILVALIIIAGFTALGISVYNRPDVLMELFFVKDYQISSFFPNITTGLGILFSWHSSMESVFLSPLLSLPIFALALIGLFSTTKGFFASRNSIASILLVFCLVITGFNSDAIVFFILPIAILVAHGIKYLLEKWYGLFPENPYARVTALFPLTVLFLIIIIPGLLQYMYGYRYNPNIVNEFSDDLIVIRENLTNETLLVKENYDFYKILERSSDIKIINELDKNLNEVAVLGKLENAGEKYSLKQIITSPRRDNSDIIYIYTEEEGE